MAKATEIVYFSATTDTLCDVVFVHGLNGDVRLTWCHDEKSPDDCWPRWLADALPQASVWSLGYDAAASEWLGHGMPISQRATNLLRILEINGIGARPVAFVGHSLGGLLIKQMLRNADGYGETRWQDFCQNVGLIVFVSTPHQGSAIPDYVDAVKLVFRPAASIKALHADDAALSDLNTWFRNYVRRSGTHVVSFHEEMKTNGFMVVDQRSADFGYPGIISTGVDADHRAICKPKRRTDLVPDYTLLQLKQFAPCKQRIPNAEKSPPTVASLLYSATTDVDEKCLDALLGDVVPYDISYHDDIAETVARLSRYDADPKLLLNKLPYMRRVEHDLRSREREAAVVHSNIHDITVAVNRAMSENRNDLSQFTIRLNSDRVSTELARRALKSFGTFASLRLIRILKRFYDVQDDKPVAFFESYVFNEDPSYCYFDWAPRRSFTGKRVFGFYYYVGVRVGPNWNRYEYVMLPLDLARRLLTGDIRGDAETFYVWVLPQLHIVGCHCPIESFLADDWRVLLLQGANLHEWSGGLQDDPWQALSR